MKQPIRRIVASTAGAVFGLALALGATQAQDATEPVAKQPTAAPTKESAVATPLRESSSTAPSSTMAPEAQAAPKAKPRGSGELNRSIARLTKFEDFDKNKDGSLAQAEIPANDELSLKFSSYDKDSDSKISQAEFATYKNGDKQLARNKPSKAPQSKPEQQ
jgi:hypothetical protein